MKPIKAWAVLITSKKGKEHVYRPNGRMYIGTEREAKLSAKVTLGDCYYSAVSARPVRVTITVEE
jgi:hypothetical protein